VTVTTAGPGAGTEAAAQRVLRYATCPSCTGRNPEGLAVEGIGNRVSRTLTLVLVGVVAAAAYFLPVLAWVIVGIDAVLSMLNTIIWFRKPPGERRLSNLLVSFARLAARVAFAVFEPRYNGGVGVVMMIKQLFARVDGSGDRVWKMGAERIRFE
jgi:hypothetical protein